MRYIEKNFHSAEVIAYEKELADNRLDKDSLADEAVHPALDGPGVYDTVKSFAAFGGLKCRMYAEQGGICCYCGCRLQYPNHPQYVVEHVFPKEKDRTLAGEYGNLLLSCRPTAEEEKQRMTASRKERKSFFHCDKAKESEVLSITPLQEDSPRYFQYDMFGGIVGTGCEARNAIATLNLGCDWLQKRREAAIEGEIFDEEGELLSDEELSQRLDTIMDVDEEGLHSEFCFVIKNVIQGLLSPGCQ